MPCFRHGLYTACLNKSQPIGTRPLSKRMPPRVSSSSDRLPSNVTATRLPAIGKSSPHETKKKAGGTCKKLTKAALHVIVDANGHNHLVYTIHFFLSPPEARVCFVEARGRHALVKLDVLNHAPADIDLSTLDAWWQPCTFPKSREDRGCLFFPTPRGDFKAGDYLTVCVPGMPFSLLIFLGII